MADLVSIFDSLGYRDVRTVAQSGNVVFRATDSISAVDANTIAESVAERHGFRARVLVLSSDALRTAIDRNPFPAEEGKALHLFFLESLPATPDFACLEVAKRDSEDVELDCRVFYLYTPEGYGRSKLASSVERCLGVAATARNWNTVKKLETMLDTS